MNREQLQSRIDDADITLQKHLDFTVWGVCIGGTLGSGAITAEVVGNPKAVVVQAIGAGISFAVSLIAHEEAQGSKQRIATYEAAQYVVDQLHWPTIPEEEGE